MAAASSGCAVAGGGVAETGPGGRILPDRRAAPSRAQHNVSNALAAVGRGAPLRRGAGRDPPAAAAFTGVEHRLEQVADRRRRPLRQRLAGNPAGRGHRGAAVLPAAARPDRRRPRQGRGPLRRSGRSRPSGPTRRSSSASPGPTLAEMFRADGMTRVELAAIARGRRGSGRRDRPRPARRRSGPSGRPATVLLSPAAASFDMFVGLRRPRPRLQGRRRGARRAARAAVEPDR